MSVSYTSGKSSLFSISEIFKFLEESTDALNLIFVQENELILQKKFSFAHFPYPRAYESEFYVLLSTYVLSRPMQTNRIMTDVNIYIYQ